MGRICSRRLSTTPGLLLRNLNKKGNPRFPLKGSFKGVTDMGIDIDVKMGCCYETSLKLP